MPGDQRLPTGRLGCASMPPEPPGGRDTGPMVTVTGTIEQAGRGGHALRLPFRAAEVFGAARPPVRVVADGQLEFRTTLASYGGDSWLGLRKDPLGELGLAAGGAITVTIEADPEPRLVTPPEELADALADDPEAAQ